MILIGLALLCLLTVPVRGGNLVKLAELRLRCLWLAPLALALQVVIVTIAPGGNPTIHAVVHLAAYALLGGFLWANRNVAGAPAISLGAALNTLAILINKGVMPASAAAQRIAGMRITSGFQNSAHVAHAHLIWLGDIIPVPGPWPLRNVLSIGDCVITIGTLILLHHACGGRTQQARSAPALKT
jgi:hypothetical protein